MLSVTRCLGFATLIAMIIVNTCDTVKEKKKKNPFDPKRDLKKKKEKEGEEYYENDPFN